jgi:hypothetical protein
VHEVVSCHHLLSLESELFQSFANAATHAPHDLTSGSHFLYNFDLLLSFVLFHGLGKIDSFSNVLHTITLGSEAGLARVRKSDFSEKRNQTLQKSDPKVLPARSGRTGDEAR